MKIKFTVDAIQYNGDNDFEVFDFLKREHFDIGSFGRGTWFWKDWSSGRDWASGTSEKVEVVKNENKT